MTTCQVCESEEAMFTVIPTGEGMPEVLGPACFARAGLDFAKQILPPEEIAQALGPMFVQPAQEAAPPKAKKRRPGETIQAEPESTETQGTDGGPDEVSATAANE
jgi:hypothetical protein